MFTVAIGKEPIERVVGWLIYHFPNLFETVGSVYSIELDMVEPGGPRGFQRPREVGLPEGGGPRPHLRLQRPGEQFAAAHQPLHLVADLADRREKLLPAHPPDAGAL